MNSEILTDGTIPANVADLKPYQPGKPIEAVRRELGLERIVKLASNENPLGASPLALEAIRSHQDSLGLYPDPVCYELTKALAARHDTSTDEIVVGGGSNELIGLALSALCDSRTDNVIIPQHSFISYKLQCQARGIEAKITPAKDATRCDVQAVVNTVDDHTKIVFVAHPNNPTGSHLTAEEIEYLISELPPKVVLFLDEAYHEYATAYDPLFRSGFELRNMRSRLIITRTFSKAYGLAGLRVGYGVGDKDLINVMHRVRRPFNVNSLAQVAAVAAIADDEFVKDSLASNKRSLDNLRELLEDCDFRCYPSLTNFMLVDAKRDPDAAGKLHNSGVIVRPMEAWGLPGHFRISAYHPDDEDFVLSTIKETLKP